MKACLRTQKDTLIHLLLKGWNQRLDYHVLDDRESTPASTIHLHIYANLCSAVLLAGEHLKAMCPFVI